jgi:hypothetical protein
VIECLAQENAAAAAFFFDRRRANTAVDSARLTPTIALDRQVNANATSIRLARKRA